jgi:hypothetical protein
MKMSSREVDCEATLVRKGGLEPPRFYPPDPKSVTPLLKHAYVKAFAAAHYSLLPICLLLAAVEDS